MMKAPIIVERFEHKDIRCIITQVDQHYCGYIKIPDDHKWYHVEDYEEIPIDVHGGLTFGQLMSVDDRFDDAGHWVGFDTVHGGDWKPYSVGGKIWSIQDMKAEIIKMAEQVIAAGEEHA